MTGPTSLPPLIRTIEELREHLQAAIELEHGTIPPYICALYSIRPSHNREAAEIIRTVVLQEMLHMVLAANMLNAVGGAPSIAHRDFVPTYPIALPLGEQRPLEVPLRRFSSAALDTFLAIEQPRHDTTKLALAIDEAFPVPAGQLANMVKAGTLYRSIGEFYAAIEQGLDALEKLAAETGGTIFTGDPGRQVGAEHFYGAGGSAQPVTDLVSARAALNLIVRQGEGFGQGVTDGDNVGGERQIAHYYRFDQLRQGRFYRPDDRPGEPSGAPISVDFGPNAVFPMVDNPTFDRFTDAEVRERGENFATCYTNLLELLHAGLNGQPSRLIESGVVMFDLRRLALELLANPVGSGEVDHAGPCFEFVRRPT